MTCNDRSSEAGMMKTQAKLKVPDYLFTRIECRFAEDGYTMEASIRKLRRCTGAVALNNSIATT